MKSKIRIWKGLIPVLASVLILILLQKVFLIGYVPTASMEPTIRKDSYIVGIRIFSEPETGDIVVFKHNGKLLVKRIAAVGGDIVEQNGASLTVPEGCFYVLGDNAGNSMDSRCWEEPFVQGDSVIAKVLK